MHIKLYISGFYGINYYDTVYRYSKLYVNANDPEIIYKKRNSKAVYIASLWIQSDPAYASGSHCGDMPTTDSG